MPTGHFQEIYAEHEALIRLDDGLSIRDELPRTAAKLVEQWRELQVAALMRNRETGSRAGRPRDDRCHRRRSLTALPIRY